MSQLQLNAYAKINLGLDVVGKRPDGYHLVRMIMQTLNLSDTLTFTREKGNGKIILTTNHETLPTDKNNLIYRAAQLLIDKFHLTDDICIELDKKIPVAAGLAGGSSDCAATLLGINALFSLGLSQKKLMEYGVTLGADVPYCILKGTALSEGIGEVLTPLSPAPNCYVVLVKPNIDVSTKWVYQTLQWDKIEKHPNIDKMVSAIENHSYQDIFRNLGNVLETVTIKNYPVIEELKEVLLKSGADNALMSGSGPTVFGLFTKEENAKEAYAYCRNTYKNFDVVLTDFYFVD